MSAHSFLPVLPFSSQFRGKGSVNWHSFSCMYDIKLSGPLFFPQLRISVEHHHCEWINIHAPPYSEACSRFEFGFKRGAHIPNKSPPWPGFELYHWPIELSLVSVAGIFLLSFSIAECESQKGQAWTWTRGQGQWKTQGDYPFFIEQ